MEDLYKKLDKLEDEIIDITTNRNLYYVDDLDFIKSDINSDWENGIIEKMNFKELKEYVEYIENVLNTYYANER